MPNIALAAFDFWLGVAVAAFLIFFSKRGYLYYLAMFPGTFLHEMAHYLVGLVCGARPRFKHLLPKKGKDGSWTLGCVVTNKSMIFDSFIAMAPFALHFLIVPAYVYTVDNLSGPWAVVSGYITAVGTWAAMPSITDFKNAVYAPISTALLGAVGYFGWLVYATQ